jgi:hypothetical protein
MMPLADLRRSFNESRSICFLLTPGIVPFAARVPFISAQFPVYSAAKTPIKRPGRDDVKGFKEDSVFRKYPPLDWTNTFGEAQ